MLVENLHAMAPGADLVYLGTTSSLDLANGTTLAVDAGLGDIVMNGWYSAGENTNQAEIAQINQTAQQAAATGISLLFASGSIGDNSSQGSKPSPEYPANDPLVTAVGATSLIVGRGGSLREVGWAKTSATLKDGDWDDDARNTFRGSGGGTSAVNAQPDYQQGVVPTRLSRRTDGTAGRAVPDVAVNGDAETGIVIGLTQRFPDGKDRYAERRHASDESATAVFARCSRSPTRRPARTSASSTRRCTHCMRRARSATSCRTDRSAPAYGPSTSTARPLRRAPSRC